MRKQATSEPLERLQWRAPCALRGPQGRCRRTHPEVPINCRRAIHRLDSANSVTICAVFFTRPL